MKTEINFMKLKGVLMAEPLPELVQFNQNLTEIYKTNTVI
jgi:hypothetical protein